jgi:hypothetical protein
MQARSSEDNIFFKQKLIELGVAHATYDFTGWPEETLKKAYDTCSQQLEERSSPDHHTSLTLLSKAEIAHLGGELALAKKIQINPLMHQDLL